MENRIDLLGVHATIEQLVTVGGLLIALLLSIAAVFLFRWLYHESQTRKTIALGNAEMEKLRFAAEQKRTERQDQQYDKIALILDRMRVDHDAMKLEQQGHAEIALEAIKNTASQYDKHTEAIRVSSKSLTDTVTDGFARNEKLFLTEFGKLSTPLTEIAEVIKTWEKRGQERVAELKQHTSAQIEEFQSLQTTKIDQVREQLVTINQQLLDIAKRYVASATEEKKEVSNV
jgi:DNA-directed RNA polymerase subunit F